MKQTLNTSISSLNDKIAANLDIFLHGMVQIKHTFSLDYWYSLMQISITVDM